MESHGSIQGSECEFYHGVSRLEEFLASWCLSGKGREGISEPRVSFFQYFSLAVLRSSLPHTDSLVTVQGLLVVTRGLSSCPVECGNFVPPPEIAPASPALLGGFLSTGSPGKSQASWFAERVWQTEEGRAALAQCVRLSFPCLVVLLLRMLINCLCPLCLLLAIASSSMWEPGSVAQ